MTLRMVSSPFYTITREREIDPYGDIAQFIYDDGTDIGHMFGFDFENFDFFTYARKNIVWVCRKAKVPVGIMMARLYPSVWDETRKVLYQDLLYCRKSSGKAAYLLLEKFIDFGRAEVNYVFTCRSIHTNLKEKSFERLGFKKLEELYLLGE